MIQFAEAEKLAEYRLEMASFNTCSLEELAMPPIEQAPRRLASSIPYQVHGDRVVADTIVLSALPYSTRLEDAPQQLRLMAQQIGLGSDYCVVGAQLYDPKNLRLDFVERTKVSRGDFQPLADRLFAVIEALRIRDDQKLVLYGFSFGADAATETTYQNIMNVNRGIMPIAGLAVAECARAVKRFPLRTAHAFASSGEDLFKNVVNSRNQALLEARGIDLDDPKAEKKHKKEVGADVVQYFMADVLGNLALMRGFSTDASHRQLQALLQEIRRPDSMVVIRAKDSRICPPKFFDELEIPDLLHAPAVLLEIEGDHSIADNLRKSAALVIHAVAA